ncbi:hypothetical protein ACFE04_000861 [Oxalis oulophora]
MAFPRSVFFLLSLALLSSFYVHVSADKKSYIVYLGVHNHGLDDSDQITSTHHDLLESVLGRKAKYGEGIIIANLDTGVWPESKSFSDEGYGLVPSKWKGACPNSTDDGVRCNKKLIGAKVFTDSYIQAGNNLTKEHSYPRDHEGHGGSPRARVAAYKICFPKGKDGGGCYYGDALKAFNEATKDGVDVISFSVGGDPIDYFNDAFALGAFEAIKKGIVVVCSAGNNGTFTGSVTNVAPWILTVAASTIDREYYNNVVLQNGNQYKGVSFATDELPSGKFYPLIGSEQAKAANATAEEAMICLPGSLDPSKVKGKIIACLRGQNARVQKGAVAKSAGAVGMILCNDQSTGNDIISDHHALPAAHITYESGQAVYAYINSTAEPQASITAVTSHLGIKPSPTMASFSSKGPNSVTPGILKPDVTAPGVNIIASNMNEYDYSAQGTTPYVFMSGTSMSCPHVSGVAGLLRAIHPDWSPAAIKSAILTTAGTRSNTQRPILSSDSKDATPFNYGHGHIRPNHAANPGLVYDLTETDYLDFLCGLGYDSTRIQKFTTKPYECPEGFHIKDFNYPSITLLNVTSEGVTASRKVKNVGKPGTYAVKIRQPAGFSVSVEPATLKFEKYGEEKSFQVTFKALANAGQDYAFGSMTWTNGWHYVSSPLVVTTSAN